MDIEDRIMSDKKSQPRGFFDAIRKATTGDKGRVEAFICEFCGVESSDAYYAFDKPFCDDEHGMEWAQERITEQGDTNRLLCLSLDEAQRVVEARDERIDKLVHIFGHIHVNSDNGTDGCNDCGLDLRDNIHFRGTE